MASEVGPAGGLRTPVGFIGLGDMGMPMMGRLLEVGYPVVAYDPRPAAGDEARRLGAAVAADLKEVGDRCEITCICVLNDSQLETVITRDGPLVRGQAISTLVVHSTVNPETIRTASRTAAEHAVVVVDAPVSGNQEARRTGRLTMMVGGPPEAVDIVRPLLDACASSVLVLGDVGAGQVGKLANQVMSLTNFLGVLDALRLGAAYGIGEEQIQAIGAVASGGSWALANLGFFDELFRNHTTAGSDQFYDFLAKDLWLAVDAAAASGTRLGVANLAAVVAPVSYRQRKDLLDAVRGAP